MDTNMLITEWARRDKILVDATSTIMREDGLLTTLPKALQEENDLLALIDLHLTLAGGWN